MPLRWKEAEVAHVLLRTVVNDDDSRRRRHRHPHRHCPRRRRRRSCRRRCRAVHVGQRLKDVHA